MMASPPARSPVSGADVGGAVESQVEELSQRYFLQNIVRWQSVNLVPLLLIGLCSMSLADWRMTAVLIVLNLACLVAMFALVRRLRSAAYPPSETGLWRGYNILGFGLGALWAGLMLPVAPTLGENIASTFVCVIIIASVAVTSMVIATRWSAFLHFLAGLVLCLLPQTIIFIDAIGPIPLVATIGLVPGFWAMASAVRQQDRALIRTQLEKEHLAQELALALERAEFLANRDSLTGLFNRRAFEALANSLRKKAGEAPLSLILIDLDHFKTINDRHGHATGDSVLQRSARLILDSVSPDDVLGRGDGAVARWGGEEFLLLLPDCPLPRAMQIAEQLRQGLVRMADPQWPDSLIVSGSFGVASWSTDAALHQCISDADAAMYRAKQAGRNRVEVHDPRCDAPERIAQAS